MYSPYLSLYLEHQGFGAFEVGVMLSLLQMVRIVGPYFWGWLADCTRQPVLLLRVSALSAIPMVALLSQAGHFAAMLMLLVLLNFVTAAQVPLSELLAVRSLRGDLSHYGRIRLWGSVGFIVAVLGGGAWLDVSGLDWYPLIGAVLLTVLCAATMFLPRQLVTRTAHDSVGSVWTVLRDPAARWFFVTAFLMIFSHAVLYTYYSLYLAALGYSSFFIGGMWAIGVVAEVLFFFFQAKVLKVFSLTSLLLLSFIVCAGRFFIIGTLSQFLIALVMAQLMHAITFAAHHTASLGLLQRWFAGHLAARGQALYVAVAYGLGGALGGLFAAKIWQNLGSQAAFIAAGGAALLGGLAVLMLRRCQSRHQPSEMFC